MLHATRPVFPVSCVATPGPLPVEWNTLGKLKLLELSKAGIEGSTSAAQGDFLTLLLVCFFICLAAEFLHPKNPFHALIYSLPWSA